MLHRVPSRGGPGPGPGHASGRGGARLRRRLHRPATPDPYERLRDALPPGALQANRRVDRFEQDRDGVRLHLADGDTMTVDVLVGADGIDSLVRRTLWGDEPKREHNTIWLRSAGRW